MHTSFIREYTLGNGKDKISRRGNQLCPSVFRTVAQDGGHLGNSSKREKQTQVIITKNTKNMKKLSTNRPLCLVCLMALLLSLPLRTGAATVPDPVDGVLTITVTSAGELYQDYSAADITAKGATTLKVIGPLNENDFSRRHQHDADADRPLRGCLRRPARQSIRW